MFDFRIIYVMYILCLKGIESFILSLVLNTCKCPSCLFKAMLESKEFRLQSLSLPSLFSHSHSSTLNTYTILQPTGIPSIRQFTYFRTKRDEIESAFSGIKWYQKMKHYLCWPLRHVGVLLALMYTYMCRAAAPWIYLENQFTVFVSPSRRTIWINRAAIAAALCQLLSSGQFQSPIGKKVGGKL